jgi:hypothetical protein
VELEAFAPAQRAEERSGGSLAVVAAWQLVTRKGTQCSECLPLLVAAYVPSRVPAHSMDMYVFLVASYVPSSILLVSQSILSIACYTQFYNFSSC